jgi:hypothetical protein
MDVQPPPQQNSHDNRPSAERQQAEERQIRALIAAEFSASLMNNTKWAELAEALRDLSLTYRCKWVDVAEPKEVSSLWSVTPKYFDSNFGPFLKLSLEWLDIFGAGTQELEPRLRPLNIPFHREGNHLRITGHIRRIDTGRHLLV